MLIIFFLLAEKTHVRQDSMAPEAMCLNLDAGQCSCHAEMKPLDRRKKNAVERCQSKSYAGTTNFVAPEVIKASHPQLGEGSYDQCCDWWSVGCIFYEMVIGRAPFQIGPPEETLKRILNWRNYLEIPTARVSPAGEDLIRKLITDKELRLGRADDGGSERIKEHPFFRDINFDEIRNPEVHPPPWNPNIKENEEDTSNFPEIPCCECKKDLNSCICLNSQGTDELDNGDYENVFPEFTFRRHMFNKQT